MTPDFPIRLRPARMWRKLQLANPPSFSVWRKLQLENTPSFSMWRKLQLANPSSTGAPASGFTLVELLVVIGIIGLLTAISVPIVMQALAKARNAAIKAEIDMLHMAIMNYKNEYGSFPPAISSTADGSLAAKHLARIFPRCPRNASINPVTNIPQQLLAAFPASADPKTINITNALTYWLSGFTNDPTQPLFGSREKLFDFDLSRFNQITGAYYPSGKPQSPYLYINNSLYSAAGVPYAGNTAATPGAMRMTAIGDPTVFGNPVYDFFNKDTFQILCAGRDEEFGTDDDLSNFWPGTRREYLDSLKN